MCGRVQYSLNFTSMFEGRHIDYRSSMVDTSITDLRRSTHRSSVFEGQHIHLRRSTHRSSKVDTSISEGRHIVTSIFEGRHIDLRHIDIRKLTHRSSKVDASAFEDRRRKHHTYNSSSNIAPNCAPKSLEWTKLHTLIRTCIKINNRDFKIAGFSVPGSDGRRLDIT